MSALMVLSALAFATQAAPIPAEHLSVRDVAYEDMTKGHSAKAVTALEASLKDNPGDPATLINLGTAHARMGDDESAARAFRAALNSPIRYRLELADGTWVDSRVAARRALMRLESHGTLASR